MLLVHVNGGTVANLDGTEYEADPDTGVFDVPEAIGNKFLSWPGVWKTPEEVAAKAKAEKEASATIATLQNELEGLRSELAAVKAPAKPAPAKPAPASRASKK